MPYSVILGAIEVKEITCKGRVKCGEIVKLRLKAKLHYACAGV